MAKRSEVGLVYLSGLVQGLALVTFPAASSIFTSPHPQGYGFSSTQYGITAGRNRCSLVDHLCGSKSRGWCDDRACLPGDNGK